MRTKLIVRWLTVLSVLASVGGSATLSLADTPVKGAKQTALSKKEIAGILAKLASSDEAELNVGLEECRGSKGAGKTVEGKIAERLDQGLPPRLAESALDVLGEMESVAAAPVISMYASHREAAVRSAALRALAHVRGSTAVPTLRHALGDSDPAVRGLAASGLGALNGHEAMPDLVTALDKRVYEAAAAIAQVCLKEECAALASRLGKLPFDVMSGAASIVLYRKPNEVPDAAKVQLIDRVRELASPEATRLLGDLKSKPKGLSPVVMNALEEATKGASQ